MIHIIVQPNSPTSVDRLWSHQTRFKDFHILKDNVWEEFGRHKVHHYNLEDILSFSRPFIANRIIFHYEE